MARIIKDTKEVREYSEDYRQGGWSTHEVVAYFCSNCGKELSSSSVKFCNHCGTGITGIRDKITERQRKRNKPYQNAYDNLSSIRSTFDRDSLEYKYLTETLKEIIKEISF